MQNLASLFFSNMFCSLFPARQIDDLLDFQTVESVKVFIENRNLSGSDKRTVRGMNSHTAPRRAYAALLLLAGLYNQVFLTHTHTHND